MSSLLSWLVYMTLALGAFDGTVGMDPWAHRQLDTSVREILSAEDYGFCHDSQYPLLEPEEGWCAFIEEAAGRCSGWEQTCKAPRAELHGAPGRLSSRRAKDLDTEEDLSRNEGVARSSATPREPDPETTVEVPAMGGLGQILFWIVVAITVIAIARAVISNLAPSEDEGAAGNEPPAVPPGEERVVDESRRAMETDVDRLLAYASDAAARGEFEAAVDFSHAALLRRLDHEGLIHLHRSRTNGDYVRDLRRHPTWRAPVRDVLRHVDRAQFGNVSPGKDAFDTIFAKVRDIVKKAAPLGVWLLIAAGLGCDTDPAKSYPWETSPSGHKATVELLQRRGLDMAFHTGSLLDLEDNDVTLVLLQDAAATEEEWAHLERWVEGGGTLIVASGETPPWDEELYIAWSEPSPEPTAVRLHPDAYGRLDVPLVFVPEGPALGEVGPEYITLLVRGEDPYAVYDLRELGTVTVMADDAVFSNASVSMGDNAAFVVELLGHTGTSKIRFVDAWATAGARNSFDSVRKSNLTPAVIQLLLLVLVLFAWRGVRFGRGRDRAAPSRLAFTQHARAMAQHYRRARAVEYAAKVYASWALERLRDRFPTAARGGLAGLAQAVARRSGRDETEVMRLLVEAHTAAESHGDGRDDGDRGETKRMIREVGAMMRDVGGMK